jgi:hypothetical protein
MPRRNRRGGYVTPEDLENAEILSEEETAEILDSAELAALPIETAEAWQLCDFILKQLHETLVSGSKAKIFHTRFTFRAPEHAKAVKGFSTEELLDWMKANGYGREVVDLTYKLICRALVFDLVEFATEAVRCTLTGSLTVAIALLRKPLKENLFYLEWILAEPEDFFAKFMAGEIDSLNLSRIDQARKLQIIRTAMDATPYGGWIEPEFLYELRFEKKTPVGLEPAWQKANHLITTKGVLRTEKENFNFVFSTDENRETQWRILYAALPLLLFHALQIVEATIARFAKRAGDLPDLTPLRTFCGMLLWMRGEGCLLDVSDIRTRIRKVIAATIGRITCSHCKKRYSVREANLRRFFEDIALHCNNCGQTTSLMLDRTA